MKVKKKKKQREKLKFCQCLEEIYAHSTEYYKVALQSSRTKAREAQLSENMLKPFISACYSKGVSYHTLYFDRLPNGRNSGYRSFILDMKYLRHTLSTDASMKKL